jgi:hypothetical protein
MPMLYKNNEKRKQYLKQFYLKNREKRLQYNKEWRLKNIKIDPNYKLIKNMRVRIWSVLKGKYKSEPTIKLLGCSVEECWQHLKSKFQPGMTKENYGQWHVDHIIPCAAFDLKCPVQQLTCFHYSNLQPLWAEDNIRKKDKINYEIK